jgi:hypothetical protein
MIVKRASHHHRCGKRRTMTMTNLEREFSRNCEV